MLSTWSFSAKVIGVLLATLCILITIVVVIYGQVILQKVAMDDEGGNTLTTQELSEQTPQTEPIVNEGRQKEILDQLSKPSSSTPTVEERTRGSSELTKSKSEDTTEAKRLKVMEQL